MKQIHTSVVNNTLVDYPRLYKIQELVAETANTPGSIAEVGVYRGGTAYLLCEAAPNKHIYLFDTFEGMPTVDESKDLHKTGDFADTSLEGVKSLLSEFKNVTITKGLFPASAHNVIHPLQFSLVHLDVDIYQSVKEGLHYFWPRLTTGGVIILDDYLEPNCPGAKLATDEFVAATPGAVFETTCQSQAIIRKPV